MNLGYMFYVSGGTPDLSEFFFDFFHFVLTICKNEGITKT